MDTLTCTQCRRPLQDGSKFCPECGARVAPPIERTSMRVPLRQQMEHLMEAALAARDAGQEGEAEAICREALTQDPDCVSAHSLLAALLEERGDLVGAEEQVQELLRLNPGSRADELWLRRLHEANPPLHPDPAGPFAGRHFSPMIGWAAFGVVIATAALAVTLSGSHPRATSGEASAAGSGSIPAYTSRASGNAVEVSQNPGAPNGAVDTQAMMQSRAANLSPSSSGSMDGQAARASGAYAAAPQPGFATNEGAANVPVPPTFLSRPGERRVAATPQPVVVSAPPPVVRPIETPSPGFAESMTRAQQDYGSADYGRALQEYRNALHAAPTVLDAARVHQQLAMTYSSMGGPRMARAEYDLAENLYQSLVAGPDGDLARQAITNIEHQKQLLETGL